MQKRLLGIFASVAVIVAACGGATTTLGAGRARPSPARRPRPARRRRRRRRTSPTSRSSASTSIERSADPRSQPGAGLDRRSRSSHALHRGLVYFDKDLNIVPALAESLGRLRRRARRSPSTCATRSTATATRSSPATSSTAGSAWSTRAPRRRTRTSWPRSSARPDLLAHGRRGSRPERRRHRRRPRQARRRGAGRQDVRRHTSTPRPTYFLSVADPVGRRARSRRSGSPAEGATEAGNYVSSGPFIARDLGPQQPDRPQAEPELVRRRQADPDRDPDVDDRPSRRRRRRAYEAGELDIGPARSRPRTSSGSRTIRCSAPSTRRSRRSAIAYYDFNNGVDPSAKASSRAARTRRRARPSTRTSGSR